MDQSIGQILFTQADLAVCLTPPQPITSTQDLSSSSPLATSPDAEVYSTTQPILPERGAPLPLTPSELAEIEHAQRAEQLDIRDRSLRDSQATSFSEKPTTEQLLGLRATERIAAVLDVVPSLRSADSASLASGYPESSKASESRPQSTTRYLKNLIPRPRRRGPSEASEQKQRLSVEKTQACAASDLLGDRLLEPDDLPLVRSVSSKASASNQRRSRTSPTARRNSLSKTLYRSLTLRASPTAPVMQHEASQNSGSPTLSFRDKAPWDVLHEGPVLKANTNYLGARWVKRYLKIKPGVLIYTNLESCKRELVPLTTSVVEKDKQDPLCFTISRTNGKRLILRASTETERNTWVKCLVEARHVYDMRSKEQYTKGRASNLASDDVNLLEWSDTEEAIPLKKLNDETQKHLANNQSTFGDISKLIKRLNLISAWDKADGPKITHSPDGAQVQQIRYVATLLLEALDKLGHRQEIFNEVFQRNLKLCDKERNDLLSTIKSLSKENVKYEEQLDVLQKSAATRQRSDATLTDATPMKQIAFKSLPRPSVAETSDVPLGGGKDEFFDADEEHSNRQGSHGDLSLLEDGYPGAPDANHPVPLSSTSSSSLADDLRRTHNTRLSPSGLEVTTAEGEDADPLLTTIHDDSLGLPRPAFVFRQKLPRTRTEIKISLWSLLKDCIGKDLTKIALPVGFNEPTSFLQRLAEDFQYSWLLEKGANATDPAEALLYIGVYTTTPFASAVGRTYKPFNPLLGETYELTHRGYKLLAEQVGHHPPTSAYSVQGKGFESWGHLTVNTKFTGKSLEVSLKGASNIVLNNEALYTFQRARMIVNNVIFGKISMDVAGTYTVTNHTTGHYTLIDFPRKSSWFRSEEAHQVYGLVCEQSGRLRYVFYGTWSSEIHAFRPTEEIVFTATALVQDPQSPLIRYEAKAIDFEVNWQHIMSILEDQVLVWKPDPRPAHSPQYYAFGRMTFELNEINELYDPKYGAVIAPTDSRFRPDQRALEWGEVDESNREKCRLEEKQRAYMKTLPHGERDYQPVWFQSYIDPVLNVPAYKARGEYWACKHLKTLEEIDEFFARCRDIF